MVRFGAVVACMHPFRVRVEDKGRGIMHQPFYPHHGLQQHHFALGFLRTERGGRRLTKCPRLTKDMLPPNDQVLISLAAHRLGVMARLVNDLEEKALGYPPARRSWPHLSEPWQHPASRSCPALTNKVHPCVKGRPRLAI